MMTGDSEKNQLDTGDESEFWK